MRRFSLPLAAALATALWIALSFPAAVRCQTPSTSESLVPANAPWTLERALTRALEANPAVASAEAGIGAADAQRRGFLSAVLPKLSLVGRSTRNSESAAFGQGDDRREILPLDDWNYRLALSQPVYAGNRERRAYEQAKIQVETARHGLAATREHLLLQVVADFLGVVEGDALLEVEHEGVELARDLVEQAKSFQQAGEVTEVEVRRAEVGLKSAQRRLASAIRQRESAASRLRLDLALDADGAGAAQLVVEAPHSGFFAEPLPASGELVEAALDRRPELRAARNDFAVSQLEVRKQRGAYLPLVTLDVFYQEQKSSFPSDSYGAATLNVTVPIWDSGATASKVRAAAEGETRARLALQAAELRVRDEIRRALLDVEAAETSLALAREQAAAAEAEYDQTFDLYQAQEATALDVRQAEISLAEARRAIVESRLDRDLARASAWYFAGSLARAVLGAPLPAAVP